ncbi:MAG: S-layer homology domain-containing protein [Acidimicrobiales bacterium]
MTIRLTRARLAIVVVTAVAMGAVSTAGATHVFTDVPDSQFYAGAVEWAAAKGITTGKTPTTFGPDLSVTRGESVTFLNRYDTKIVQPGLGDRYTKAQVDSAVTTAITNLMTGTTTIPSGTTVTGFDQIDHSVIKDNEDMFVAVQLPGRAPVALTDTTVNFATNALAADGDAACTGTVAAPTAPAGKVCIYVSQSANVDGLQGHDTNVVAFDDRFFLVGMVAATATQGVDAFLRFTWAYTAP